MKAGLPAPQPPLIKAETAPGTEGALQVTWDPKTLSPGAVRVLVFCEDKPPEASAAPAALADGASGKATVQSLAVGQTYHLAARAVNGDGDVSPPAPPSPPRPLIVRRHAPVGSQQSDFGKSVHCGWQPHLLDVDVSRLDFVIPAEADEAPQCVKKLTSQEVLHEDAFTSGTPYQFQLALPEAKRIGVLCVDKTGNAGEVVWADVVPEKPAMTLDALDLWLVPPTENVSRTAEKPATAAAFAPVVMRGQRKSLQLVIRPRRDLHEVEVSVSSAQTRPVDVRGSAAFINYVHLDKNSIATPAEELVWPAPGDYPDEISDQPVRDLPANQAQPVYIELNAAHDAVPGKWGMQIMVRSREGNASVGFDYHVSPVTLPQRLRLPFVYWFSWSAPCKEFAVEERSADGWRVLGEIGKQMVAHHERVVVIPWTLVRTWRGADGKLTHDFRDFDRYLETFQSVGVDQLFCLSHIGGRSTGEWECPTMTSNTHEVRDLATGDPLPRMDCVDLLSALQDHLEKLGLLSKFRLHIADEPIPVNVESYRQLSARARRGPEVPAHRCHPRPRPAGFAGGLGATDQLLRAVAARVPQGAGCRQPGLVLRRLGPAGQVPQPHDRQQRHQAARAALAQRTLRHRRLPPLGAEPLADPADQPQLARRPIHHLAQSAPRGQQLPALRSRARGPGGLRVAVHGARQVPQAGPDESPGASKDGGHRPRGGAGLPALHTLLGGVGTSA